MSNNSSAYVSSTPSSPSVFARYFVTVSAVPLAASSVHDQVRHLRRQGLGDEETTAARDARADIVARDARRRAAVARRKRQRDAHGTKKCLSANVRARE